MLEERFKYQQGGTNEREAKILSIAVRKSQKRRRNRGRWCEVGKVGWNNRIGWSSILNCCCGDSRITAEIHLSEMPRRPQRLFCAPSFQSPLCTGPIFLNCRSKNVERSVLFLCRWVLSQKEEGEWWSLDFTTVRRSLEDLILEQLRQWSL